MTEKTNRLLKRLLLFALLTAFIWAGWKVGHGSYYKSGDGLGYYLGLVGGLMMLTLLGYSLRKHFSFMQRLGKLKYWFRFHMMLGILGPILILFHSTFRFGSMNAAVALYCMMLVALSGLIGRFVYSRIHRGLYGSRSTLKEVRTEFTETTEEIKSGLHTFPKVEKWLADFEHEALEEKRSFMQGIWYFLSFDARRILLIRRCKHNIQQVLGCWRENEESRKAIALIRQYLAQIQTVAQFKKFEQIFSAWHVVHIPLMYMMVATSIFHVIWVHMY